MFGSTILDVAAGIIFGFLAISLFTERTPSRRSTQFSMSG